MKQEEAEEASGLLEQLGLGGHAWSPIFHYLVRQSSRWLARAMMIDPEMHYYDEQLLPGSKYDGEANLAK